MKPVLEALPGENSCSLARLRDDCQGDHLGHGFGQQVSMPCALRKKQNVICLRPLISVPLVRKSLYIFPA